MTIAVLFCLNDGGANLAAASLQSNFQLFVNPRFASCLEKKSGIPPVANVKVVQSTLNDTLTLSVTGLKPNLDFDLFTVQRSPLNPDGTVNPDFSGFGLAWYQSDVQANSAGKAKVVIKTILINQIFGFDSDAGIGLQPTNTFDVGFWFNNPEDAVACGFTGTTPFNGQHNAGPLAMISVPDATTGLGPLCLSPNTSTDPATCNP